MLSLRCLMSLSTMAMDGGVVQRDALVHFLLLHRGLQQADGAQALAVLARMAVFMSSVIWSLRLMAIFSGW